MQKPEQSARSHVTRREMLVAAGGAAVMAAGTSLAAQQFGPPPHQKGPLVFLDYDQVELDAAYNQTVYEPNLAQIRARFASNSEATRARLGPPERVETPEFQRQSREFAAAVQAAGKPVQLLVGENYAHMEMAETLANPYGLAGRAALEQMNLPPA